MAWLGNIPSLLCLLFILQSYEIALNGVAATDAVPNTAVNGSANQGKVTRDSTLTNIVLELRSTERAEPTFSQRLLLYSKNECIRRQ